MLRLLEALSLGSVEETLIHFFFMPLEFIEILSDLRNISYR